MSAALILAILGFGISATLALVKIWETFLAKSKFSVHFQWFDDSSDIELRLSVTIANIGHRPDSVRAIHVCAEDGEIAFPPGFDAYLPVLLQPGEISSRFNMEVRTDIAWDPHASMFAGTAVFVTENSVGRIERFPIPNPSDIGLLGVDEPPPPQQQDLDEAPVSTGDESS